MRVLQIFDVARKESEIYYRQVFEASARYHLLGEESTGRFQFIIEMDPMGDKKLHVKLIDEPDYPSLPLICDLKTSVKHFIDTQGLPA